MNSGWTQETPWQKKLRLLGLDEKIVNDWYRANQAAWDRAITKAQCGCYQDRNNKFVKCPLCRAKEKKCQTHL